MPAIKRRHSPSSSPARFAYRDPAASDTESDNGASDAEIDASLASFPPEALAAAFKGKGKAVDRGERLSRRSTSASAKLQVALGHGRRPRSSCSRVSARLLSPPRLFSSFVPLSVPPSPSSSPLASTALSAHTALFAALAPCG